MWGNTTSTLLTEAWIKSLINNQPVAYVTLYISIQIKTCKYDYKYTMLFYFHSAVSGN